MAVPHWPVPSRRSVRVCAWILIALACTVYSPAATGTTPSKRTAAGLRINASAPHAVVWRQVYDRIPEAWKADRLIVVREVTGAEMDRLVGDEEGGNPSSRDDDSVVDGYYQNDGGDDEPVVISLRDSLKGQALRLVFAHEYAHYVWDDLMPVRQHKEYSDVWRQQKRTHALVTQYAAESPDEGFAEAASYYVVDRAVLRRRDSRSLEFLDHMMAP